MHIEHVRKEGREESDLYKGPFKALVHVGSWGNKAGKAQKEEAVTTADKNKMDYTGETKGAEGEERAIFTFSSRTLTCTNTKLCKLVEAHLNS